MRMILLAAIGAATFAAPAAAADLATMDCVVGKLKPALQAQIEADVTRNLAAAAKPSYDPSVATGLSNAAEECAVENKWSPAAVQAARIYTLAKIGWPIAQRVVGEKGFDAAMLEAQFQTLPEETRNRPLTTEEMQQLVISSVTEEAQQTRENAMLLNQFFSMLNTMQYASVQFAGA